MSKNKETSKGDRSYMFDGQHDDEEVIYVFRRHPVVMRKGLMAVLLGMLPGLVYLAVWPPLNPAFSHFLPLIIGMAIGSIILFHQWIGWYYTIFIVSDQRFVQITQKGLFNRSVVDFGLDKIQNVNFQVAGIQETLLGFGTILIQTFVGDLVIDKVHHPARAQEKLVKIIKELGYNNYGTPLQGETDKEED